MSSSAPLFNVNGLELKTPTLLVSPEDDYVAILEYGENVAILRSQAGRCIVTQPVRRGPQFAEQTRRQYEAQGFVKQALPSDDFAGFVQQFMTVAGFTAGHVQQSFRLGRFA